MASKTPARTAAARVAYGGRRRLYASMEAAAAQRTEGVARVRAVATLRHVVNYQMGTHSQEDYKTLLYSLRHKGVARNVNIAVWSPFK